jgi:hypothetical protein
VSYGLKADTSTGTCFGVDGVGRPSMDGSVLESDGGRWIWTNFGLPGPTRTVAIIWTLVSTAVCVFAGDSLLCPHRTPFGLLSTVAGQLGSTGI